MHTEDVQISLLQWSVRYSLDYNTLQNHSGSLLTGKCPMTVVPSGRIVCFYYGRYDIPRIYLYLPGGKKCPTGGIYYDSRNIGFGGVYEKPGVQFARYTGSIGETRST